MNSSAAVRGSEKSERPAKGEAGRSGGSLQSATSPLAAAGRSPAPCRLEIRSPRMRPSRTVCEHAFVTSERSPAVASPARSSIATYGQPSSHCGSSAIRRRSSTRSPIWISSPSRGRRSSSGLCSMARPARDGGDFPVAGRVAACVSRAGESVRRRAGRGRGDAAVVAAGEADAHAEGVKFVSELAPQPELCLPRLVSSPGPGGSIDGLRAVSRNPGLGASSASLLP